jgi:hypothetical protein
MPFVLALLNIVLDVMNSSFLSWWSIRNILDMRLLCLAAICVRPSFSLFDAPRNFGDANTQAAPAASESQPEESFPVINVRFSYPATLADPRRWLSLGKRQATIIGATSRASASIEDDVDLLLTHLRLQKDIVGFLIRLPTDLYSPLQKQYIKELANSMPESYAHSSFIQGPLDLSAIGVEENPQINIAVEDNTADFSRPADMTPSEGTRFITSLSRSWMSNRRLIIEIMKVHFKRMELLYEFLIGRIRKTARFIGKLQKAPKGSFIQDNDANNENDDDDNTMLDLDVSDEMQNLHSFNRTAPLTDQPSLNSTERLNVTSFATASTLQSVEFPLVMTLRSRVLEGGRSSAKALAGLIDLWNEHKGSREAIRASMVMADCMGLMMMKKTPDYVKNLAGTLMTLISGIPSWAALTPMTSGSDAHVNIIVPRPSRVYKADKEMALATGGD